MKADLIKRLREDPASEDLLEEAASALEAYRKREMPFPTTTTTENLIGPKGPVYVSIQCGCGLTIMATEQNGRDSHWDLFDDAAAALDEHIRSAPTPYCQPWLPQQCLTDGEEKV